jgi:shikimate kinase
VNIKEGDYGEALECIAESRLKIYNEVSDFIVFSSNSNSFDKIIKIQELFEMEEIIELKRMEKEL